VNTRTILQKLKSTKLWTAIAGIAYGIAISLGADASEIQVVSGAVVALLSAMSYIITEGRIDAAAVKAAVEKTQDAVKVVKDD